MAHVCKSEFSILSEDSKRDYGLACFGFEDTNDKLHFLIYFGDGD